MYYMGALARQRRVCRVIRHKLENTLAERYTISPSTVAKWKKCNFRAMPGWVRKNRIPLF